MKKLFGFSRLSRSSTIFLIYFYFITSTDLGANAAVLKCCPQGQVLSVPDGYTCARYNDHNEAFYPFRVKGDADRDSFLCGNLTIKSSRWETRDISSNADMSINVLNTCVDLLYNAGKGKSVLYQCFDEGKEKTRYESATFKTFRMCCGKNETYDHELRDCKMRKKFDPWLGFHFWSPLVDRIDFATAVAGPPVCQSALLDFVVDLKTDLTVLGDGSVEVGSLLLAGIWCFFI